LPTGVARDVSSTDDKYLNNRSFVCGIGFAGKKILVPGDIEVEGWEKLLERTKAREVVKGTSFFVASHHGHKTGFTTSVLDATGIPDLYIVSGKEGDEEVDSSYSKDGLSNEYLVLGDNEKSKMISTRERGGSILITIHENGTSSVQVVKTDDNLSEDQRIKLNKKTARVLKHSGIRSR